MLNIRDFSDPSYVMGLFTALEARVTALEAKKTQPTVQAKRPLNVDIACRLRVIGWAKDSFLFESDEGDGYDISPGYTPGEGPTLKPHHFEEWAEQLSYAAEWCREKARQKSFEVVSKERKSNAHT